MHGTRLLKAYSRTQATIALSSGEAELYAMVRAASEGLGVRSMARDLGIKLSPRLFVDASAALGIAQRKGLGRIRHLDCQALWIQDAIRQRRLGVVKVAGALNPADLMKKAVDGQTLLRLVKLTGLCAVGGVDGKDAQGVAVESVDNPGNPCAAAKPAVSDHPQGSVVALYNLQA